MPPFMEDCEFLPAGRKMLDSEVIVQDRNGVSDFAALRRVIAQGIRLRHHPVRGEKCGR